MTVQELRNLLNAAERASGLPWTLTEDGDVIRGGGEYLVYDDDYLGRRDTTALLVAAVNALPALLDVAEVAQALLDSRAGTYKHPENRRDAIGPEGRALDAALDRLGDT